MVSTTNNNCWILKSEPSAYSFDDLLRDKHTLWDGIRNFEARNHLRKMQKGDLAFIYHSNIGKELVGLARITQTASADKTAPQEDWSVVEITAIKKLTNKISLEQIKKHDQLNSIGLVTRPRLSVIPISQKDFLLLLKLAHTSL